MTKNVEDHDAAEPAQESDCGCGCHGAGDCEEASAPSSQARRALLIGTSSVAFIATLGNRRAFAGQQCGPISHAASLTSSQHGSQNQCGGLTPGFWKNHKACVISTLGGDPSSIQLGQKLSNLYSVDPGSASVTFKTALCNPSSPASHWACAILNALSPSFNPSYGYSISQLNNSILSAFQANVSASNILTALKTLENDYGTGSTGCKQGSIC